MLKEMKSEQKIKLKPVNKHSQIIKNYAEKEKELAQIQQRKDLEMECADKSPTRDYKEYVDNVEEYDQVPNDIASRLKLNVSNKYDK